MQDTPTMRNNDQVDGCHCYVYLIMELTISTAAVQLWVPTARISLVPPVIKRTDKVRCLSIRRCSVRSIENVYRGLVHGI
jgi:hypothetical protein